MSEQYVVPPEAISRAETAGRIAARYSAPDPASWIERSAVIGVAFGLLEGGGFYSNFLDAELEEASFLDAWLHATPGAADAVERLLRRR